MHRKPQAPKADARIVRVTVGRHTLFLGRVSGIRIGVHVSWLVLFAFVTLMVASGFTSLPPAAGYALGALCAIVLFVSVVGHELAHALAARRFGVRTASITMFLLGGIATLEEEPATPRADALVALAGPAMSALIALVGCIGLLLAGRFAPFGMRDATLIVAAYVTLANAALAVFNLLPAYPMDGGRVLRAVIWKRTNDRERATFVAARIGMSCGLLIVAAAVLICAATHELFFGWYALLGTFILRAGWSHERAFRRARRNVRGELAAAA
jgi:Zn-dependent protease